MTQDKTNRADPANYKKYTERIHIVKSYIYDHLSGDLSLSVLANIAFLSPYHFHRIYRSISGETIAQTVRHVRLDHAALLLAKTEVSIDKVAKQCGYNNTQSFNRLFKSVYNRTPAVFRMDNKILNYDTLPNNNYIANIREVGELEVVYVEHTSPLAERNYAFKRLCEWLNLDKNNEVNHMKVRVLLDNPHTTRNHLIRALTCKASTDSYAKPPIKYLKLKAGCCAVVSHLGPYETLEALYDWFFTTWLPSVEFTLDDRHIYEKYLNNCLSTPPDVLLTDVYIPIKQKLP